jgi:hypothetical protein
MREDVVWSARVRAAVERENEGWSEREKGGRAKEGGRLVDREVSESPLQASLLPRYLARERRGGGEGGGGEEEDPRQAFSSLEAFEVSRQTNLEIINTHHSPTARESNAWREW